MINNKIVRSAWTSVVLMVSCFILQAQASDPYVVKADITEGTCTVDVTPPSIVFPMIDADALALGGVHSLTPVAVSIKSCGGTHLYGRLPYLNISGTTVVDPDNTEESKYLFHTSSTAGNDVPKLGFVLSDKNEVAWYPTNYHPAGENILLQPQGTPPPLYSGETKSFWAGVACGSAQNCIKNISGDVTGKVAASITFTFKYQ